MDPAETGRRDFLSIRDRRQIVRGPAAVWSRKSNGRPPAYQAPHELDACWRTATAN